VEAAESAAFAGAAAGAAAASVDLAGAEAITCLSGGVAPVSADAGRKQSVSFVITRRVLRAIFSFALLLFGKLPQRRRGMSCDALAKPKAGSDG